MRALRKIVIFANNAPLPWFVAHETVFEVLSQHCKFRVFKFNQNLILILIELVFLQPVSPVILRMFKIKKAAVLSLQLRTITLILEKKYGLVG